MKKVTLRATTGKKGEADFKEAEFEYADPENLKEATELWGEEKVFNLAVAQAHTDAVNAKRLELKGKEPGVVAMGKNLADKIKQAKESGDTKTLQALELILGMPL